jgi:hypothetical protein
MMRPGFVVAAIAALVVLAAVWWWFRGEAPPSAPETERAEPGISDRRSEPVAPTPSPSVPSLPSPAPTEQPVRETVVDGVRVRDHRTGDTAPRDMPHPAHPPEARRIPAALTQAITNKLRPVVMECAASIPPEARGTTPRIDGQLVIAIRNKQVSVTKTVVKLRDIAGASAEPVQQCIEQKSLGLMTPAGDEADLEDYGIALSFRVP